MDQTFPPAAGVAAGFVAAGQLDVEPAVAQVLIGNVLCVSVSREGKSEKRFLFHKKSIGMRSLVSVPQRLLRSAVLGQPIRFVSRAAAETVIGIPVEVFAGERRVASTPDSVKELTKKGFKVSFYRGVMCLLLYLLQYIIVERLFL